jgi:hypothetical protein
MEYQDKIDLNETPNGRILGVIRDEIFGFWKVVFSDGKPGGQIPTALDGKYTSQNRAQDAIKAFLRGSWEHAIKLTRKKELRAYKESVASG